MFRSWRISSLARRVLAGEEESRRRAAAALARIHDVRAVKALIAALDNPLQVYWEFGDSQPDYGFLLESLCKLSPISIPLLEEQLLSRHAEQAATVLRWLKWQPRNPEQRVALAILDNQPQQISKEGVAAVAPLLVALRSRGLHVEDCVRRALELIGEPAVPALCDVLAEVSDLSKCTVVLKTTVESLGNIRDQRAYAPLRQILPRTMDESLGSLGAEIVLALSKIGGDDLVECLITALSGSEVMRDAAALSLGELRDSRAVQPLLKIARDSRIATEALGSIGDPAAYEPLITLLHAAAPFGQALSEARAAIEGLGRLGDLRAVQPLVEALINFPDPAIHSARENIFRALQNIDDKWQKSAGARAALPELVRMLLDATVDAEKRQGLATIVAEIGGEAAFSCFSQSIRDPDWRIRYDSVRAVGKLRGPQVIDVLRIASADGDSRIRSIAVEVLGDLADPCGIDLLIDAYLNGDAALTEAALVALKKMPDSRAKKVIAIIEEFRDEFRKMLETGLRTCNLLDSSAVAAQVKALNEQTGMLKVELQRSLSQLRASG